MSHTVIFAKEFDEDFTKIEKYIFDNDFDATIPQRITDKIVDKLSSSPNSGKIYKGSVKTILVLKLNVVYYRVENDTVYVMHIRAGKQDKNI